MVAADVYNTSLKVRTTSSTLSIASGSCCSLNIDAATSNPSSALRIGRRVVIRAAANGTVVLDGQLFVMGGDDGETKLSTVEVFEQELERWEKLPARLQTARSLCAAAVLDGKLYAVGGLNNDGWLI